MVAGFGRRSPQIFSGAFTNRQHFMRTSPSHNGYLEKEAHFFDSGFSIDHCVKNPNICRIDVVLCTKVYVFTHALGERHLNAPIELCQLRLAKTSHNT